MTAIQSPGISENNIRQRIEAELVRILYANAPVALVGTGITALIVLVFIRDMIPLPISIGWFFLLCVLYAVRLYQVRRFLLIRADDSAIQAWKMKFVIGALLSGILWGSAGIAFFVYTPPDYYRVFMLVSCGLAAASMVTHASSRGAYYAFLFPAILPTITGAIIKGDLFDIMLGILSFVFMLVMLYLSNQMNGIFRKEFEFRFINEELSASLRESEEKYRIVSDFTSDWEYWQAPDKTFRYISPSCRAFTGYSVQQFLDDPELYINIVHPDDRDSFRAHLLDFEDDKVIAGLDFRILCCNNEVRWISHTCSPVYSDTGQFIGRRVSNRDITDRKKAEEALKNSEHALVRAQEIAHLGNWDWDIVTNDLRWSDEIYRIFGLTPQEFSATYDAFLATIHTDDRDRVVAAVNDAINNNKNYSIEHRVVHPDGSIRIVSEQGEVTRDKDGKAIRMIGTVRDITERKRYEEKLKEANAAKDKFFSIIAHDLKNPFNALLGSAEALHDNIDDFDKDDLHDMSNIIYRSAKNAYALLENLLEWSRAQLDRLDIRPHDIDLRDMVHESIMIVESQAENKQVTIINTVSASTVYADTNLLKTILRNLLSNAIKYTDTGGAVTVNSRQNGDMVEVSVTDTGVGMPPDVLQNAFRIDTKYSTPGTAKETGTGLGLILCKEFVERQGGRIWVESEVEKGTTFTFSLPVR